MVAQHTSILQALLVSEGFEGEVYPFEAMAKRTSYRIGGPARFYVQVASLRALSELLQVCEENEEAWIVVGRGSNLLVSDEGFSGVLISLGGDFKSCRFDEESSCFVVGAGMSLAALVQEAYRRGLAGLEFAVGTPGTVGGALVMNAGSAREWIGSRVKSVITYSVYGGLKRYSEEDLHWAYRKSFFAQDEVILECEIAVESALVPYIRGKMDALLSKRKKSQPLDYPSCGSVFKNPAEKSAGVLIDEAGFKGHSIGGATVSHKHANFIINTGNAKAADVCALMELIQTKVKEDYGIELQPEVRLIGFT